MSRSGLPLVLVALLALTLLGLGWFYFREPPSRSADAGSSVAAAPEPERPAKAVSPEPEPIAPEAAAPAVEQPAPASAHHEARVAVGACELQGRVHCPDGDLSASELAAIRVYLLASAPQLRLPTKGRLAQASVNADGSFAIGPVPVGKFFLHAEGGAYVQQDHASLDAGELAEPVVLEVHRGAVLEGLVHAHGGGPIAGAEVAFGSDSDLMDGFGMDAEDFLGLDPSAGADESAANDLRELRESVTESEEAASRSDAGGRFAIGPLPENNGALITITAPGFARYRQVIPLLHQGKTVFVDAELEPAGRLAGTVRDDTGQPIAGASVHALRSDRLMQGILGGGLSYDRVRTDERGEYLLDHLAPGRYRVEARAKSWPAQLKNDVDLAAGQEVHGLDFTLDHGLTLAGVVADAEGHPVAGASVQATESFDLSDLLSFTSMMRREQPITTGADGRFEIGGLKPAKHSLHASAPHLVDTTLKDLVPGGAPITVTLGTPGRVAGVVVSTITGEPVTHYTISVAVARRDADEQASVRVQMSFNMQDLMEGEGSFSRGETIDDPQGRFEIGDLFTGTAHIEVRADHHAPAGLDGVTIKAGETTRGLIVFVEPEGIVQGIVRDAETHAPIAKATVTISSEGEGDAKDAGRAEPGRSWRKITPETAESKETGEDGRFEIGGLPRGSASVHAGLDDYTQKEPLQLVIVPGKTVSDLVLELARKPDEPKGNVEGFVYTAAGKPKQGAMVFASKRGTLDDLDEPALTDGRGHFEIQDLPAGHTMLMLIQGDADLNVMSFVSMLARRKSVPVDVRANETVQVEIREDGAAPRGCRVHGRALAAGSPLPGAMIFAIGEHRQGALLSATADAQGRYEIADVPPGRWWFSLSESISETQNGGILVEVPDAPELERDLVLPAGKITGRVIDAATRAPIEGVAVFAIPEDLSPTSFLASAFDRDDSIMQTNASGAFTLPSLAPGRYTVRAGGPSSAAPARAYAQAVVSGVTLAGDAAAPLEIALAQGGVVAGVVHDQAGHPLERVSILLRDAGGDPVDSSRGVSSDGGGRYRYAGLKSGRYFLIAAWADHVTQASEVFEIGDGKEAQVDFTLEKGVPVTVRVKKLPADVPAGEVEVEAKDERGRIYRRILSDELLEAWLLGGFAPGEYQLGPYPPGKYTLVVRRGDAVLLTRAVTLANPDGETFELE